MNTATEARVQLQALNASVSTDVLVEAVQRFSAQAVRDDAENFAFASVVAELARRDSRFAAALLG